MNLKKIQQLLKSVWAPCHGKDTLLGSERCEHLAVLQLVQISKTTKKIKSKSLIGTSFSYDEDEVVVEGNYCNNCGPIRLQFAKEALDMETWNLRQIPGIEEAVKIMKDK